MLYRAQKLEILIPLGTFSWLFVDMASERVIFFRFMFVMVLLQTKEVSCG